MKFYDALQLDPAILKRKSAACGAKREKAYYWAAMAARSVLIVSFAIVFMALGVSLVLTAGQVFGVERFMWMGFACASLLSAYPYSGNTSVRFRQRLVGAAAGCGAFFLLYLATPEAFHPLMGPLGGLCLGFCTDYRYKTAMNCFGALMLGAGIYGLQGAVILRMVDTFLGVSFGLVFAALFHRLAAVRLLPQPEGE
ncbi:FUSC family protein [Pseudoflavonifractor phocaeensis]|uniref:FUSC family protein n=1 Tax=Pseudoflavonifractor phocaeensis TaxID=1870988 RepID=UPI001956B0A2|nr:FUSC family protein [Pseudoflavonifractor phocaeensis]MBM6885593.1 FUSC family protein [Pseudoflavonifractor phocaeensis]